MYTLFYLDFHDMTQVCGSMGQCDLVVIGDFSHAGGQGL